MAEEKTRGPVDIVQVIVGLVALAIAVWGLLGGPSTGDLTVFPWIGVGVAGAVGVGLVIAGGLRSRTR
ncbi:hypothetical protein ACXVUM_14995 [Williamsia sp. SKLECPSW1]